MRKKLSGFLGFSGSPGSRTFFENPRDRDPEHLCKNPRDFYIPGIGIFFRGMGNPDKKPPLVTTVSTSTSLLEIHFTFFFNLLQPLDVLLESTAEISAEIFFNQLSLNFPPSTALNFALKLQLGRVLIPKSGIL